MDATMKTLAWCIGFAVLMLGAVVGFALWWLGVWIVTAVVVGAVIAVRGFASLLDLVRAEKLTQALREYVALEFELHRNGRTIRQLVRALDRVSLFAEEAARRFRVRAC